MKYRITAVSEANTVRVLTPDDIEDMRHDAVKVLPREMKLIDFKVEKIQSTIEEPTDSISAMVSKLKAR